MKTVVIYGRDGCCLCDEAATLLERVRVTHPFELERRDIEESDDLFRAYLERIPVVSIDGVEAFELFVDEAELERLLKAPAREPARDGRRAARPESAGDGPPTARPESAGDGR